nr:ATP:cob(I)alamin adenosyltransferase [Sporolactobacillus laevolacticus]
MNTRTGDKGQTNIIGGRLDKDNSRVNKRSHSVELNS